MGSALGIHLRPAGAMCDTAVKFDSLHSHLRIRLLMQKECYIYSASGVGCGDETLLAEASGRRRSIESKVS